MASKPPMLGGTAIKPVERHGMEAIRYFFHNPDTGEIMTRTPLSWLLITVFYVIYYSCLAAFWAICMVIFLQTVDYHEPKWQNIDSIIGKSPGLGLRPKQSQDLIDSAIIMFNKEKQAARSEEEKKKDKVPRVDEWSGRIKEFLEDYENETRVDARRKDCTFNTVDDKGKRVIKGARSDSVNEKGETQYGACHFPIAEIKKTCGANFGYDKGTPCIFLKLNKIFGLENDAIDQAKQELDKNYPNMDQKMKDAIASAKNKDHVWVNCYGKYPADKEALGDGIEYIPKTRGIPNYYFPYLNQEYYVSPLVAVKFSPKSVPGQLIHIECRAYAKNIGYDRRDKVGISVFELQIMDQKSADEYNKKFKE